MLCRYIYHSFIVINHCKHVVQVLTAVCLSPCRADALSPAGGGELVVPRVELLRVRLFARGVFTQGHVPSL
jgi:hypothetical protein